MQISLTVMLVHSVFKLCKCPLTVENKLKNLNLKLSSNFVMFHDKTEQNVIFLKTGQAVNVLLHFY